MITIKLPRVSKYKLANKWKRYRNTFIRQANALTDASIMHGVQKSVELMASLDSIDTGMSAASTLPFLRDLDIKYARQFTPDMLDFIEASKKGPESKGGYANDPSDERSIERGLEVGANVQYKRFQLSAPYFVFSFDINVYQWTKHEASWGAVNKMVQSIGSYFEANAFDYIRLQDAIEAITVEFD